MFQLNFKERQKHYRLSEKLSIHDIRQRQFSKIKILLEKADRESLYYKQLFRNNKIDVHKINSFQDFRSVPVLEKSTLKQTDPRLFLTKNRKYLISRKTAGTTGQPIEVFLDFDTLMAQVSARRYFFHWHDISFFDREARFWGRGTGGYRNRLKNLLLNRRIFQFTDLDKDILRTDAVNLIKFDPNYFYGYSSLILRAAEYWEENKFPTLPLKAIICTAETLHSYQKKYIANVFKCPVYIEYGCSETDIIAFQCEKGNYHICTENIYLELDNPEKKTGEVIITDLNNLIMPLIRYKIGDQVSLSEEQCICGRSLPLITRIEGRTTNQLIYLPNGAKMHAVVLAYLFEDLCDKGYDINKFKVIQTGLSQFDIIMDIRNNHDQRQLMATINQYFAAVIGNEIMLNFSFKKIGDESGKYDYFVSLEKYNENPNNYQY